MTSPIRLRVVAVLSLVFTCLFFLEYLRPVYRVHVPYDMDGFHYPLADYAFQSLRQGRFPEWDPSIYCGLSYVANIQAAVFYPPMWLVFAANAGRRTLSYSSFQAMELAHVWLAFLLCFVWLRRKRLAEMACALGAGVFAYGGYMMLQLQHLGLIIGYTWIPLGLWGIDEAVERRSWRPLWKVAAASALAFLGGYPPTWLVFAACMLSYAVWHWKTLLGTAAALGASLMLAAVQLLPALEATSLKEHEARYGAGVEVAHLLYSYLLPNFYDFGLHVDVLKNPEKEYLYLGAPAILGLLWLVRVRRWRELLPVAGMMAVCAVVLINPHGLVWDLIQRSSLLDQVCRSWYFLAGVSFSFAPLAAFGLDACLGRRAQPAPRWLALGTLLLVLVWSARELAAFFPLGRDLPAGWSSAVQPAVTAILCALALWILPGQKGAARAALAAAVLLCVGVDYKISGTSKRVNAATGQVFSNYQAEFPGMDAAALREMRAHPSYRVALDETGPQPLLLRHLGLLTPQGFDPFLTTRFAALMGRIAHFRTNWLIDIDPENKPALQLLGVRYFITAERAPAYPKLKADPDFRFVGPDTAYFKVFEYTQARPPYGWTEGVAGGSVLGERLSPERREFLVQSDRGGRFALSEQWFPGWSATVDGAPVAIQPWNDAFQSVPVPAGRRLVVFRYRSAGLRAGALLTLLSLAALLLFVFR